MTNYMEWSWCNVYLIVTSLNFFSFGLSIIFDIILINKLMSLSLNYVVLYDFLFIFCLKSNHITVQTCTNNHIYLKLLIAFVIESSSSSSFVFFFSSITDITVYSAKDLIERKFWEEKLNIYKKNHQNQHDAWDLAVQWVHSLLMWRLHTDMTST